jgi:hypothetical protein
VTSFSFLRVAIRFFALLGVLWSGQAAAIGYSSNLAYSVGNDTLYGYAETYATFEYPYESCFSYLTHMWWGDMYFELVPPLCNGLRYSEYGVGVESYVHGPNGTYGGGRYYNTGSVHLPYTITQPTPGNWSLSADHYLMESAYYCYVDYYWLGEQLQYQLWCEPGEELEWYLDTTSAWAYVPSACTGVPLTMSNEYSPGVTYPNGVTPQIACSQFGNYAANYQYLSYFTWSELNGGWQDGNPHTGWGYIDNNAANGLTLLRVYWNAPLRISSGYRCPHGNNSIPGASTTSHHMRGRAFDLYTWGTYCPGNCWTEEEFNLLKAQADALMPIESFNYHEYTDRHYHVAW